MVRAHHLKKIGNHKAWHGNKCTQICPASTSFKYFGSLSRWDLFGKERSFLVQSLTVCFQIITTFANCNLYLLHLIVASLCFV